MTIEKSILQPLAARMRPATIEEFIGQEHLLGEGRPLHRIVRNECVHSMILWGPPGTGKTTLAALLAHKGHARFEALSAVLAGVKDIRSAVDRAEKTRELHNQNTVLFVDEVHAFNRAQQDAFLPYVEKGTFTFIGATTENPAFEVNKALLSRARVYALKRLTEEDIIEIINRALKDKKRGLGERDIQLDTELRNRIARAADGDARQALNFLEVMADFSKNENGREIISPEIVAEVLSDGVRQFDKGGEIFYDQISALHKSIRGSSPDAALYWMARMLDGGCRPDYIARRLVRAASEDIGNADPRALQIALHAWKTYEQLGSPEGDLALAQAAIYLACAPKSNAIYTAFTAAMDDIKKGGSLEVPLHLRNAPAKLMKDMGYGKGYRYPHDEPHAYIAGENYFPKDMPQDTYYYQPVERGLEIKIAEKLKELRALNAACRKKGGKK